MYGYDIRSYLHTSDLNVRLGQEGVPLHRLQVVYFIPEQHHLPIEYQAHVRTVYLFFRAHIALYCCWVSRLYLLLIPHQHSPIR